MLINCTEGYSITHCNKTKCFATPIDAIRALIGELSSEDLNGLRLLNMVRTESLYRRGYTTNESQVGTQAIQSVSN